MEQNQNHNNSMEEEKGDEIFLNVLVPNPDVINDLLVRLGEVEERLDQQDIKFNSIQIELLKRISALEDKVNRNEIFEIRKEEVDVVVTTPICRKFNNCRKKSFGK